MGYHLLTPYMPPRAARAHAPRQGPPRTRPHHPRPTPAPPGRPQQPTVAAPDLQEARAALTMDLVEQPLDLLLLGLLVRRARVAMVEAVGEIPDAAFREEAVEKVVALD